MSRQLDAETELAESIINGKRTRAQLDCSLFDGRPAFKAAPFFR